MGIRDVHVGIRVASKRDGSGGKEGSEQSAQAVAEATIGHVATKHVAREGGEAVGIVFSEKRSV